MLLPAARRQQKIAELQHKY